MENTSIDDSNVPHTKKTMLLSRTGRFFVETKMVPLWLFCEKTSFPETVIFMSTSDD